MSHLSSCFITLTYSDDNLPYNLEGKPQLCKRDIQLFMKKLRKYYASLETPIEIRYFFCGEYGSRYHRPHYHAIIFGVDLDVNFLEQLWGYGLCHVGSCTSDSIQYVAGYVLKKFVNKKQDTITPEFTLMSRKPGIGFYAINSFMDLSVNVHFNQYIDETGDIPTVLSFGSKSFPLDRYLKFRISDALGVDSDRQFMNFVNKTLERQKEAQQKGLSLVDYELEVDKQKRLNRETLSNIFTKRSDL